MNSTLNRNPAEPEPKYVLVLTLRQAVVVKAALDFYSRMGMGQLEVLSEKIQGWTWNDKKSENPGFYALIREHLNAVKAHLGHSPNSSYGIFNDTVPEECRTAYDIQQVLRYAMAQDTYAEQIARGGRPFTTELDPFMHSNKKIEKSDCYSMKQLLKQSETLDAMINVLAILRKVDEDAER